MVILWKTWTIVYIDLLDRSNMLFGCIIILGKMFAKSFHHATYKKYDMSTRQNDVCVPFMESKDDEEHCWNTDD